MCHLSGESADVRGVTVLPEHRAEPSRHCKRSAGRSPVVTRAFHSLFWSQPASTRCC